MRVGLSVLVWHFHHAQCTLHSYKWIWNPLFAKKMGPNWSIFALVAPFIFIASDENILGKLSTTSKAFTFNFRGNFQRSLEGCELAVAMEEGCEWAVPLLCGGFALKISTPSTSRYLPPAQLSLVQRVCFENLNTIYLEIPPAWGGGVLVSGADVYLPLKGFLTQGFRQLEGWEWAIGWRR